MKTLATVLLVLGLATSAAAYCTYNTIFAPGGRTLFCTTCCYAGFCNTTCY